MAEVLTKKDTLIGLTVDERSSLATFLHHLEIIQMAEVTSLARNEWKSLYEIRQGVFGY